MRMLDDHLLANARCLIVGRDDPLEEMVIAYKQAVELYNEQSPGHDVYRIQPEVRLREYVRHHHGEANRQNADSVIELFNQLAVRCAALNNTYDEIEKSLAKWFHAASLRVR